MKTYPIIYTCPDCGWQGHFIQLESAKYIADDGCEDDCFVCPDCGEVLCHE